MKECREGSLTLRSLKVKYVSYYSESLKRKSIKSWISFINTQRKKLSYDQQLQALVKSMYRSYRLQALQRASYQFARQTHAQEFASLTLLRRAFRAILMYRL